MKRIIGTAVLMVILAIQMHAQTAQDLFKQKFPQLGTTLKLEKGAKVDKTQTAQYRELYANMKIGLEEIAKRRAGVEVETEYKIFNVKELKEIDKAGQLNELETLLNKSRMEMKIYLKDKTQYGIDSIECIEKLSILKTLKDQKDYHAAYSPFKTLFVYYPISSTNIYSWGEDILEFKMQDEHNKAADESAKGTGKANNEVIVSHLNNERGWFDTLMIVYKQRIRYFGDAKKYGKGYIEGKIGQAEYKFNKGLDKNDPKLQFDTAYKYLKQSVQQEKADAGHTVIMYFFVTGIDRLKNKKITPDGIIEDYLLADQSITQKIIDAETYVAKYPDKPDSKKMIESAIPAYKEISDKITETFTKCPCSSCEVLDSIFNAKYGENKTNAAWLKKSLSLLERKKCKESSFFEKGSVELYKLEPSAASAYNIFIIQLKKENYTEAAKYIEEAHTQETDSLLKAKYLYEAAIVARTQNQLQKARSLALEAAQYRPNWGEPYLLIAKMYASSAGSCGSDEFEQLGTFWAAYDKAQYAKNVDNSEEVQKEASSLMGQYSGRFPTKEQGFMREKYEGNPFTVGCWINENTTIRFIK